MSLIRISGPPDLVVSLAEIRSQVGLEAEDTDQDARLVGLLRAAQASIDGNASWLGRALTTQEWRLNLDAFPWAGVIELPLPPCQSIESLTYIDTEGTTQSILDFQLFGVGSSRPARVSPAYGARWPSTRCEPDSVSVRFTCGYGGFNDVPEDIRAAILLMVQGLYDGCSHDDNVNNLLMPHRTW